MRSGRRRFSLRSKRRCLMDERMSRELYIKACSTFLKSSELSWLAILSSRKPENLLLGNVSCYQYLPSKKDIIYNSILVIVRDLSIDFMMDCHIHGLERHQLQSNSYHCQLIQWAGADTNQCTWLMEVFIPFNSMSATETQSPPPSPSPPDTALKLDHAYHSHVFYEDI